MLQLIETDSVYASMLINWFLPIVLPFALSMLIGPRLIAVATA